MERLLLGDINRLHILRHVDFGLYLDGGPAGEILLPKRYTTRDMLVGQEIDVFLYLDQEERIVATTETPKARVGEFAFLRCSWVNQYGAFLDWGLMKDLFCPFREQKMRMEKDKHYIVYVTIDEESYRIMASAKVERYISSELAPYRPGDEVDLLVWQKTDLGFKVIVDNRFGALIYEDQIYQDIRTGDRLKGYISQVRGDGKIDVALQPSGRQQTEQFAEQLLRYLNEHEGHCSLGDKSDAEDIKQVFHVSKKTFKRAVGDLYRRRLIRISDEHIELV